MRKVKDALDTFDQFTFQDGPQDFMWVLFAGFGAQMFSEKIAEHTRRGMQGALARPRVHSIAYGYRKRDAAAGPNREIDPGQAAIVRQIFSDFASGKSARATAIG